MSIDPFSCLPDKRQHELYKQIFVMCCSCHSLDLRLFVTKLSPLIFVCNLGMSCHLAQIFSLQICFQPEWTVLLSQLPVPCEKKVSHWVFIVTHLHLLRAVASAGHHLGSQCAKQDRRNSPVFNPCHQHPKQQCLKYTHL